MDNPEFTEKVVMPLFREWAEQAGVDASQVKITPVTPVPKQLRQMNTVTLPMTEWIPFPDVITIRVDATMGRRVVKAVRTGDQAKAEYYLSSHLDRHARREGYWIPEGMQEGEAPTTTITITSTNEPEGK